MLAGSLFDPAGYAANGYAVPYLVTALLTLCVAAAVFIRERKNGSALAFLFLLITVSAWLFCYFGLTLSAASETALVWSRFHTAVLTFIPFPLLLFVLASVKKLRRGRIWLLPVMLLTAAFCANIWSTSLFVSEPYRYFWGYYPRYGPLSAFFLLYFFAVLLTGLYLLHREQIKTSSPLTRKRMKIFFSAFLIAYFASVDYLPMYGIAIYPFGYIPFFAGLMLLAYGILRYRLTDITSSYAADQIIKTMPDGLLVIDRDNIARVTNQKAEELFSKPGRPLAGNPVSMTGIAFFQESRMKRLIETASVQTHEITFLSGNRGKTTIELATSSLKDKKGKGVAVICIAKDITERKQAEKALREREKHYRLLAENVTGVIWTMNRDFKFTYVSPSVRELRGYSPEEAARQSLEETFTPSTHTAAFKLLSEMLAAGTMGQPHEPQKAGLEYLCKNGDSLPVEVKISFIKGENGAPDQILGISKDITERELARKSLENSEKYYRELVQALPDPLLTLDRHGYIIFLNRAAENLFGFSLMELEGKHITQANLIAEDSMTPVMNEFTNIILGKTPGSFSLGLSRRNGTALPFSALPRILRKTPETLHIEILFRALSEKKAA